MSGNMAIFKPGISQARAAAIERLLSTMLLLMLLLPTALGADDALFQTSTINALMMGDFYGSMSLKELKSHGDFGLGTLDRLDGELVGLDGEFYQVKSDGNVYPVNDTATTPFAEVAFFKAEDNISLNGTYNLTQIESYLDSKRPTRNIFYAIRIDGIFEYVKTRVPEAQREPYPRLTEALGTQKIFQFNNTTGTVIGFWWPSYAEGINVPGYHLHFITGNRSAGGHLLDIRLHRATVAIDELTELDMALPNDKAFYQADLSEDQQAAVRKAESNPK
jgi:acetolactate decarboxylase